VPAFVYLLRCADGTLYYTMRIVPGRTMAHAIERIVCIATRGAGMSIQEFGETISRPSQWA